MTTADASEAPGAPRSAAEHALRVLGWSEVVSALATRCASAAASREALALLPNLDEAAAAASLAETIEARGLLEGDGLPVGGVRDVARVVDLAARGGRLEPGDLAEVARTAEALARLRDALVAASAVAPILSARGARIARLDELVRAVDRAVDEHGRVRDDASPRLAELLRRKAALARSVESRIEALRRDPDVAASLSDDFVTIRDDRHVLPVRSDRRARVPGILHGRSGSGQSLFIEPTELVELNNDLRSVGLDVEEEVARILRDLSTLVGVASADLATSLAEHRAIDLAHARARLARDTDATVPSLGSGAPLDLRGLAHPMLLLLQRDARRRGAQPGVVVRNDVALAAPALGLVVSGPNTGGKTVLLKAVGLACLMARAGMAVACEEGSSVPFVDVVLADIGDEQSIEKSLSSFSGHLAVLRDILAECEASGDRALVLLDEIMAGTDPVEGGPLAQAVLEELARLRARVVVTTHLGSLKAFAADSSVFVNAGMELDDVTFRPTWRVRMGLPGASAALVAAERLGLPPALVARARELAGTSAVSAEKLLRDLDAARAAAVRAQDDAVRARADAERKRAELERRLAEVTSRDQRFVSDERAAFEREMRELREQAADVTRKLQQEPGLAAAADAVKRLEEIKSRAHDVAARALPSSSTAQHGPAAADLVAGAKVRSTSMERVGTVLAEPDARGRVRVAFGGITMAVPVEDLAIAGPATKAAAAPRDGARSAPAAPSGVESAVPFTPQSPRNTCDLRGQRVDEALSALSSFLERAASTGERSVVVIHGHGTGALKAAVRSELKLEPRVSRFRPGGDGEGGDGTTVATLA